MTVSEVSRTYGVSPRMLRHYEKLGLMDSMRKEDYAYRVYRPEDIRRLRQILVLRKLRVSLKEIGDILADSGSAAAVAVLEKNLAEMDGEILAMTTVRDVIREFLDALKQRRMLPAGETILEDGRLLVTVTEGKYHQVRRMLASRGLPVLELRRLSIGALHLDESLGPGGWKELTQEDLCRVFST